MELRRLVRAPRMAPYRRRRPDLGRLHGDPLRPRLLHHQATRPLPLVSILFLAFIASCGIGHLLESIIFWSPVYRLAGVWKASTAMISWATVFALVRITPKMIAWPTLSALNEGLQSEIDRRAAVEEELRESNRRLEDANRELKFLQSAVDHHAIVAMTDARGRITSVNDAFCEISGYDRSELIGQDHRIVNSGFHPKSFFKDMYRTIASGEVWHGDLRNRAKDGRIYWVKSTFVPFVGEDGKVRRYVAIRDDITHLKEIESRLSRTVAELSARTVELDLKNAELEQLIYTVSHDLKTPLVTILGFASHVSKDMMSGDAEAVADDTTRIIRAANKLKRHIDDLLELGRIGRVKQPSEPVNMDAAMDEVLEECAGQIRDRKVRFTRRFEAPVISADRHRLMQLLQNLVGNALTHGCDPSDPWIEIGTIETEEDVRLYVKDNGGGVAPEHHERIFAIFQHLGTCPDSSGVGLAHVRRIAEVHGGKAWIESALGAGATFWTSFARSEPQLAASDQPQERTGA